MYIECMYVHIIGVAVALFRCAQKRYEIPRNAFSNLDRFLRSDRQPSEPTTTAAAAQQDQQQCSHTHTCTHAYALLSYSRLNNNNNTMGSKSSV